MKFNSRVSALLVCVLLGLIGCGIETIGSDQKITVGGDGHESISPDSIQVQHGFRQSFVVKVNSGYSLSKKVGGSCPAGSWSGTTYTTGRITTDCTVSFNTTVISSIPSTPPTTTLASSVSTLGLAMSGNARLITITNTGAHSALNVTYSTSPVLPTGTNITPANCGTIAPSGTCTLTITPGSTASTTDLSSDITTPSILTVTGDNVTDLPLNIYVLTIASAYQSGFVFVMDDTTPNTGSIGGTILALLDQTAADTFVPWDSDPTCVGGLGTGVCGPTMAQSGADGISNTTAIIAAYTPPQTLDSYAAGICSQYNPDGLGAFYLPSTCELDSNGDSFNGVDCVGSPNGVVQQLSFLIPDGSCNCPAGINPSSCLNSGNGCLQTGGFGLYWSSTESTYSTGDCPNSNSCVESEALSTTFGGPNAAAAPENQGLGGSVRCARALIP